MLKAYEGAIADNPDAAHNGDAERAGVLALLENRLFLQTYELNTLKYLSARDLKIPESRLPARWIGMLGDAPEMNRYLAPEHRDTEKIYAAALIIHNPHVKKHFDSYGVTYTPATAKTIKSKI